MDWGDPLNWPYIIAIFLTPFVALLCLVTIFGPGWFFGLIWVIFVLWLEPEEVERHRNSMRGGIQ
jgi:hypothetical protein